MSDCVHEFDLTNGDETMCLLCGLDFMQFALSYFEDPCGD